MTGWFRSQSVPAWEVAAQLGHKQKEMSTTEIYAPFDPVYLSKSVEAIDCLLEQLPPVKKWTPGPVNKKSACEFGQAVQFACEKRVSLLIESTVNAMILLLFSVY